MFSYSQIWKENIMEIIKCVIVGWGKIWEEMWEEDVVKILEYICECSAGKRHVGGDKHLWVISM